MVGERRGRANSLSNAQEMFGVPVSSPRSGGLHQCGIWGGGGDDGGGGDGDDGDGGDGGGGDGGGGGDASARDPRLGNWVRRDSVGLAAHGGDMYCDFCDLHCGCPNACMARDMLQQTRIKKLIEKQRRRRARRPADDPDGGGARHALYKEFIAWQWASPLGAGNRVRLPKCVTCGVRKLFPNPVCGAGCDYDAGCVARGHYTGFRTAAESRAVREGWFDADGA